MKTSKVNTYEDFILPLMAVVEAIGTKGASPGTAAMGQRSAIMQGRQGELDRIRQEKEDEEVRKERAYKEKLGGFQMREAEAGELARTEASARRKALEARIKPLGHESIEEYEASEKERKEIEKEERAFKRQKELKKMEMDYKKQKDADVKSGKSFQIPGTVQVSDVGLSDVEKKNLRNGVAEFKTFKKIIGEYRDLVNKYGTTELLNREVSGKMGAYSKNLQLKVKNLAQLGVLSKSDIPFITEQIPQPGFFKTKEGMLGALNATEKMMNDSVNETLKAAGLSPIEDLPEPKTKPQQSEFSVGQTATNPQTGQKIRWNGSDWEAAQ